MQLPCKRQHKISAIMTQTKTIEVNGMTLHWSDPHQKFMVPVAQDAPVLFMYDEAGGLFFPVINPGSAIAFRQRSATTADGTTFSETLVFRNPADVTAAQLAQQKLRVRARLLDWQYETVDTLAKARPLMVLGVTGVLVSFFISVAYALDGLAAVVAANATAAFAEIAYYLTWGAFVLAAIIVLKFVGPLLLRRARTATAADEPAPVRPDNSGGDTIIQINASRSSCGGAQNIVDNRNF